MVEHINYFNVGYFNVSREEALKDPDKRSPNSIIKMLEEAPGRFLKYELVSNGFNHYFQLPLNETESEKIRVDEKGNVFYVKCDKAYIIGNSQEILKTQVELHMNYETLPKIETIAKKLHNKIDAE